MSAAARVQVPRQGLKLLVIGVPQKDIPTLPFNEAQILSMPDIHCIDDEWPLIEGFSPDVVVCGACFLHYFHPESTSSVNVVPRCKSNTIESAQVDQETPRRMRFDDSRLTARHKEILVMLHAGLRNREIADQLAISIRTVKSSLAELFLIFDVSNRTELLGSAIDLGIFQKE
jgi:DNA-binding CsgD family transcriptional regulator